MQPDESDERRRYFRIEDEVILSFREVPAENVPSEATTEEPDSISLSAKLELLSCEARPQIRKIEREYPDMGSLLRILEKKIDLIAHAVTRRDTELAEQPARKVSLSASGLSFASAGEFNVGSILELNMVLPPALVGLVVYGRVVCCKPMESGEGGYHVAVDFVGLRDLERELLIRHIVKRQMQQLRERKQSSE